MTLPERTRRATDHIGRGTYTGPNRRSGADRRTTMNRTRYIDGLQNRAEDEVLERLYEQAMEDGDVGYMRATRTDPGCYDREIDLDMSTLMVPAEDSDEETGGALVATVIATVNGRTLFEGEVGFDVGASGYLRITEMEAA